jgi:hypothetical protein
VISNGRWPSVPTALADVLYTQFGSGSTQLTADFEMPAVQVTRLGGNDDGKTDFARMQVIVIAASEEEAETLSEDIRHFLVDTRPIRGAGLLLDGATTEVAPHRVPYADPQVSEYLAVYVVTSRRG